MTLTPQEHSMWLLNTARAELKFFPTPESVPGGYAILSHVWDKEEQTFQEIQALRIQCAENGTNPRNLVHDKVREFCALAERGGHQWGWADMCCIDKTSSTELSEAIVSMYRYYTLADVCYAYLRDVPTEESLHAPESAFRESRWHKRGWTLQELIAPSFVVFLSSTWEVLGAKADLADLVEEVTRVPVAVLKRDQDPSAYCVAARMSWAANRETTRPEDEAYCLMGIFGIFMPPLYGEGRNAFFRLQEEILRWVDDPSIFAWGEVEYGSLATLLFSVPGRSRVAEVQGGSFFAASPSEFRIGHHIQLDLGRNPSRPNLWGKLRRWKPSLPDLSKSPTFNITSYGVMAHLPVFTLQNDDSLIALLLGVKFVYFPHDAPQSLGLFLRRTFSFDRSRPLYEIAVSRHYPLSRLHELEFPFSIFRYRALKLEWRTIYIVHSPRTVESPAKGLQMFSRDLLTPFHISQSHIIALLQHPCITFCSLHQDETVPSLCVLSFKSSYPKQEYALEVDLYLGLCIKSLSSSNPQHWARIVKRNRPPFRPYIEHVCAEHHVDIEPRQTESFVVGLLMPSSLLPRRYPVRARANALQIQVELAFQRYALNPDHIRTVHINFNAVPVRVANGIGSDEDEYVMVNAFAESVNASPTA